MHKPGTHIVFHRSLKTLAEPVLAVLLVKRTLDVERDPGLWGLVGGKVERDETPGAAALREAREELGLRTGRMRLSPLCVVPVQRQRRQVPVTYFSCPLDRDLSRLQLRRQKRMPDNPDGKVEGEGLGWFSEGEVIYLRVRVRPEDLKAVKSFFASTHGAD